jgi:uncharacterized membrane protein YbaN (DUF454 family)
MPMPDDQADKPKRLDKCFVRWFLIGFGWLNVGLGLIGVVIPGLPTMIFMLIALWAFSKSSERFQKWLWNHPRFGAPIQGWHRHRVISKRAKALAVGSMSASFLFILFFVAEDWMLPSIMAGIMVPVSLYLITRASVAPEFETEFKVRRSSSPAGTV